MPHKWPMKWVEFKTQQPVDHGYYYIHYKHKDGFEYFKAIWWNGIEFKYKDYVIETIAYLPKCFKYYCPAMLWAELGETNDEYA